MSAFSQAGQDAGQQTTDKTLLNVSAHSSSHHFTSRFAFFCASPTHALAGKQDGRLWEHAFALS